MSDRKIRIVRETKQDVPYEDRQYVDSQDEVPDDVQAYEGDQEDTWYYDITETEQEEDGETKTREELIEEAGERFGDKKPYPAAQEAGEFIKDNILKADPKDLQEAVTEYLDWDEDNFEVPAKQAVHEHTKVEEDSSLHKPVDYEDYDSIEADFRNEYSSESYFKSKTPLKEWVKGNLFNSKTAPLVQLAAEKSGNSNIHTREEGVEEEVLNQDVDDADIEALEDYMEFDRERIREKFGDRLPVFRGLKPDPATWQDPDKLDIEGVEGVIEAVEQGEDVELEHSCLESWSTNPIEAVRFSKGGGIIIQDWMDVDEVLASATSSGSFVADQAEYIRMHENETETYQNGEEVFLSEEISPLSIAQSAIQMWQEGNAVEEKQSSSAITIPGEMNQSDWLSTLRDEYEYEDQVATTEKQDVPYEHRQYINDLNEAPDDVHIYDGEQEDAMYYDVRETEQDSSEGGGRELRDDERLVPLSDSFEVGQRIHWEDDGVYTITDIVRDPSAAMGPNAGYAVLDDGSIASFMGDEDADYIPDEVDSVRRIAGSDGVDEKLPQIVPSDDPKDWNMDWDNVTASTHEQVDLEDSSRDMARLVDRQKENFRNHWESHAPEDGVKSVKNTIEGIKDVSLSDSGQKYDKLMKATHGVEGEPRAKEERDTEDPTEEEVRAMEVFTEASRQFAENNFGTQFPVHRGLGNHAVENIIEAVEERWVDQDEREDTFKLRDNPSAVFTTDEAMSYSYDKGLILHDNISSQEVLAMPEALLDFSAGRGPDWNEGQVDIAGWDRQISEDQLEISSTGIMLEDFLEDPVDILKSVDDPRDIILPLSSSLENNGGEGLAEFIYNKIQQEEDVDEDIEEYAERFKSATSKDGNDGEIIADIRTEGNWLKEASNQGDYRKIDKQDVPYEYRQYVDHPSEAPDDVQVYEGEQEESWYYDTRETEEEESETSENDVMSDLEGLLDNLEERADEAKQRADEAREEQEEERQERVSSRPRKIDGHDPKTINLPETPGDMTPEEVESIREESIDELSKVHGAQVAESARDTLMAWDSFGYDSIQTADVWAAAADSIDGDVPEGFRNAVEYAKPEEVDAIQTFMEISRDAVRERFGDEITLYRGFNHEDIQDHGNVSSDEVTIQPRALESWTLDEDTADGYGSITAEQTVDVEDVGFFSGMFMEGHHSAMKEMTLVRNDPYSIDREDITSTVDRDIDLFTSKQDMKPMPVEDANWTHTLMQALRGRDSTQEKQDIPYEHRQYVDSRDEAPDDVQVYEGDQDDALYYDVRETEEAEEESYEDAPEIEDVDTDLDAIDDWRAVYENSSTEELQEYYDSQDWGARASIVKHMLYFREDSDVEIGDIVEFDEYNPSASDANKEDVKSAFEDTVNFMEPTMGAFVARQVSSITVEPLRTDRSGECQEGRYIAIDTEWDDTVSHETGHALQKLFGLDMPRNKQNGNDPDRHPTSWDFGLRKGRHVTEFGEEFLEDMKEFWDDAVERKRRDINELGREEEEFEMNEMSTYQWEDGGEFICELFAAWTHRYPDLQMIYPEIAEYFDEQFRGGQAPTEEERW